MTSFQFVALLLDVDLASTPRPILCFVSVKNEPLGV